MKHARAVLAPLALMLSLLPSATAPWVDAEPVVGASPASAVPESKRHAPWQADYPATREVDGATVYAQTEAQVADLVWALERYASAGLELPHVEAWLHSARSYCDGPVRKGRSGFATWRGGVSIVFGCGSRHTLLHELGHVYDRHMLTDEDRAAFMALRGVSDWQDDVWLQSGQEHLADVLAWALSPVEDRHAQTAPRDVDSLVDAYRLATGLEPLSRAQSAKVGGPV